MQRTFCVCIDTLLVELPSPCLLMFFCSPMLVVGWWCGGSGVVVVVDEDRDTDRWCDAICGHAERSRDLDEFASLGISHIPLNINVII